MVAHQQDIGKKGTMHFEVKPPPQPPRNVHFRRLLTLLKAVLEMVRYGPKESLSRSVRRKIVALKKTMWLELLHLPESLCVTVKNHVARHMRDHHRKTLRGWKEKARQWKISDSAAYHFLRNPAPTGVAALKSGDDVASHPWDIQSLLFDHWGGGVES